MLPLIASASPLLRLPLLTLHICGGLTGLFSGTVAVAATKGSRLHRTSGNIFTAGMLTLAATGLVLGILKSQNGNIVGGLATFYLIGSGWLAGRRSVSQTRIDYALPLLALSASVAAYSLGSKTLHTPSANTSSPASMSFFFAAVLLLAAVGDLRALIGRGLAPSQRIIRHLWRMCFGLFIATGSFFLGQQQVFPAFLRGSLFLTVPALLPLPLLLYWVLRVRFGKTYPNRAAAQPILHKS